MTAARPAWSAIRRAGRAALGALGCGLFTIFLLSLRQVPHVPEFIIILLIGLAGLAAWRPGAALMVLAALVPVVTWIGRTWNPRVAWPETLAVAFAAGYLGRAGLTEGDRRDDLQPPIVIFTALIVASLAVRLVVLYWTIGGAALRLQLWQSATADYFIAKGGFSDLDAAMRLIEGLLLLGAAANAAQTSPAFGPRLARCFVVGAAAAAALNLWRLWQGALRVDSPFAAFVQYLTSVRYNVHYGDVNAAGSYFVMALLAAIGLTIASRGRWVPAAVVIASSLVLAGSRTALLAGALAGIVWIVRWYRSTALGVSLRWRAVAVSSILVIGIAASAAYYLSARRNVASSTALEIRAAFARTTLRMIETHPAFGVGIGRYQERSGSYSAPILIETFRLRNENAHNNFLQVLGELGVTGFAAFLAVLGYAGFRGAHLMRRGADPLQRGIAAGLLAFVLTWLAGHPLLIDEPALMFWLLLGTAAGWGRAAAPHSAGLGRARVGAILVSAVVALSIPVRATQEQADANLEHRGIGLSLWQPGEDGVRYRLAGVQSTVFVPGDVRVVTIPLRSVQPDMELMVELRLDGRPANVVRVPGNRWHELRMALPSDPNAPRFYRLDLRVADQFPADATLLMVGKVSPR